jgi:hypothetical protein
VKEMAAEASPPKCVRTAAGRREGINAEKNRERDIRREGDTRHSLPKSTERDGEVR